MPGALPHRIDPPPPVGIDPRVDRAVQHAGDRGAGRAFPHDLALERAGPHPDPYLNALLHEIAHHPLDRADLGELREDQPHHGLDLLVRIKRRLAGGPACIAGRQRDGHLTAAGLVDPPGLHPLLDQVEFGRQHRPLQPQQQPVVVLDRVINAVEIGQQRTRQRTQLDQLIPVLPRSCQARHLRAQHQPDMPQGNLGDQPLETRPIDRAGPGFAQIIVDHHDPGRCPAHCRRPVDQRVLQARRLAMVDDLLLRALPYVDHRQPAGLTARHLPAEALPRHQRGHDSPSASAGGSSPDAALAARTALPAITASQCTAARRLASGSSSHRRAVTGSGVWGGDPLPRPRRHIPSTLAGAQPLDNLDQPQQPLTADYRTLIRSLTTHRCSLPSNSCRCPSSAWRCGCGRRGRPGRRAGTGP